ncbi:hypothetical protein [Chamaesiphon sp.]
MRRSLIRKAPSVAHVILYIPAAAPIGSGTATPNARSPTQL